MKLNPLAVCLKKTCQRDTDNITVGGFDLYHKFQEAENSALGVFPMLINENILQNKVTLNINLQLIKTVTLVYLPPCNHLKFYPKDLRDVINQLLYPDGRFHHTLEEVNIRGKQLKDLILKNYLILFNDKSPPHIFILQVVPFALHK